MSQQKLKFGCRGVVCHVTGAAGISGLGAGVLLSVMESKGINRSQEKKEGDVCFCGQAVQSTQPTVARQCVPTENQRIRSDVLVPSTIPAPQREDLST